MNSLKVNFQTKTGKVTGVKDLSFSIFPEKRFAWLRTGSGKSVSSLSIMRLVEFGGGKIILVVLCFLLIQMLKKI